MEPDKTETPSAQSKEFWEPIIVSADEMEAILDEVENPSEPSVDLVDAHKHSLETVTIVRD